MSLFRRKYLLFSTVLLNGSQLGSTCGQRCSLRLPCIVTPHFLVPSRISFEEIKIHVPPVIMLHVIWMRFVLKKTFSSDHDFVKLPNSFENDEMGRPEQITVTILLVSFKFTSTSKSHENSTRDIFTQYVKSNSITVRERIASDADARLLIDCKTRKTSIVLRMETSTRAPACSKSSVYRAECKWERKKVKKRH